MKPDSVMKFGFPPGGSAAFPLNQQNAMANDIWNPVSDGRYAGRRLSVKCDVFWHTGPKNGFDDDPRPFFDDAVVRLVSWSQGECFSEQTAPRLRARIRTAANQWTAAGWRPESAFGIPVGDDFKRDPTVSFSTIAAEIGFDAVVSAGTPDELLALLSPYGPDSYWYAWGVRDGSCRLELSEPESGEVVGRLPWSEADDLSNKPDALLLPCFMPPARRLRLWSSFGCAPEKLYDAVAEKSNPALSWMVSAGAKAPNESQIRELRRAAGENGTSAAL